MEIYFHGFLILYLYHGLYTYKKNKMEKFKLVLRFLFLKEKLSENDKFPIKVVTYNEEKLEIYFKIDNINLNNLFEICKIIDNKLPNLFKVETAHYKNVNELFITLNFEDQLIIDNKYESNIVSIKPCKSCGYQFNASNYTYCYECNAYLN